jgi:chemosensory pili system protein ChpA (sensor histidine kinase/response regulator)
MGRRPMGWEGTEPSGGGAATGGKPLAAVVVEAGGRRLAVPDAAVAEVWTVPDGPPGGASTFLLHLGRDLPLLRLREIWGEAPATGEVAGEETLLELTTPAGRLGLIVDRVLSRRELLGTASSRRPSCVNWMDGTAVAASGERLPLLAPGELVRRWGSGAERALLPSPASSAPDTVLIADERPSARRALSELVEDLGFRPLVARDGVEALEVLIAAPHPPALLLLDAEMPRMNGEELLTLVRAQGAFRPVPVVLMTSVASSAPRFSELGASASLLRPFQEETVAAVVRVLAGARRREEVDGDDPGG